MTPGVATIRRTMTMQWPDFRLDGRVALVTGAGRGIGLGIAKAFAAQGCAVAIQDIDVGVATAEADAIERAGGKAIAIGGDIADLSLPARVLDEVVRRLGGLHILVNNASIQQIKDYLQLTAEEIERIFRADAASPILFCQAAVPIFQRQKWGRILNVGSIQGLRSNPDMLPYAMSKSAMQNMTIALARRHAAEGITVNLLAPGWFNTYRNQADFPNPGDLEEKGKHIPMGRIGEPSDTAGAAVLLCSEAGSYITGQTLYVDGGMSIR
jgi:NAD(P)-dependent dehydrogenase (short-subunit alcohol dehydrogenase family)